ncbi:acylneuraminate cytidylyltransferase family protein [bacterium]|nr:acylneuraminate cytidylyltransferase family protein [bacterium]
MKKLNIVAIICARAGSKGIKNKNIKKLLGKPLLYYSIKVAKSCEFISSVVVSTDGNDISKAAVKYGADVPIIRPSKFATDDCSKIPALKHMINHLEKIGPKIDIIIDLDPTNVLRIKEDIEKGLTTLINTKSDAVISVFESHHNPYWTMFEERDSYLSICKKPKSKITCRQKLPKVLSISGNFVISWKKTIMENGDYFNGKITGVSLPAERCVDIDTPIEFKLTELLMRERLETKN